MNKFLQRFQSANATHLWLLSGLILAFTPHLSHLPITLILLSALLMGWRLGYELRIFKLPGRFVRILLTLIAITTTFVEFNTLLGRQAGVGLLVVMLCLKLMEMKEDRDVIVAIGLGYFVVVTVFLFNQSIFIGAYMLLVVVLLTTALVAHNRENAKIDQRQNLKLASTMLLQAAPLMILLFVLFPRIPGPLWSLPNDSFGGTTGLSDTMSPGNISQLSDNDAVAFRVQFEDEIPPPQQRYWRGPVFSHFDGRSWTNSGDVNYEQAAKPNSTRMSYRAFGNAINYTVTLVPNNQSWLFALEMAAALPLGSDLSPDYEIITRQPVQQLKRYNIQSYPNYQLDPEVTPNLARYLQLPERPTSRIQQLVKKWRSESKNRPGAIVNKALQHFREQAFYYTREPPLLFNNPVDEFLFNTRRGYCEHYASAFVYLMRASGIPARVVTGYQGGETNPVGDYFIVRQANAHAWSEVWLEQQGWVRFDPTSVIPPSRIENSRDLQRIVPDTTIAPPDWVTSLWRNIGYNWDNINRFWNQWILNYDTDRQRDFLTRLISWFGFDEINWRGMVTLLISGMTIVFGFIALSLLKKDTPQKDPAVIAYQQFCRKLARHGLDRDPAEGFTAFSLRACEQFPEHSPGIKNITLLYQRLRYAPNFPTDGLKNLQLAVKEFRFKKAIQQ